MIRIRLFIVRTPVLILLIWGAVGSAKAQSLKDKLLRQYKLDSIDLSHSTAFDSLPEWVLKSNAFVDTTVILSDIIIYSIVSLGNSTGTSSLYYLLSYDRHVGRVLDLVYLHDAPDIDQDLKRYSLTTHSIWRTGEIGTIEYDHRVTHPGTLHETTSIKATGRRFWKVGEDGRITGGKLEVVK